MASHCMCRVVAWRQCGAPRPCHSAVDCLPLVHPLSLSFSLALCGLYQFSACRHSSHWCINNGDGSLREMCKEEVREYGRFVGLALTVSQPGALLFVQSFSHSPFLPLSISLLLLHFAYVSVCVWVCLLLTKFVGIFVLYSVTFFLCLSTHSLIFCFCFSLGFSSFSSCALCSFDHLQLSLYLLFKTIFIDCRRDAKTA